MDEVDFLANHNSANLPGAAALLTIIGMAPVNSSISDNSCTRGIESTCPGLSGSDCVHCVQQHVPAINAQGICNGEAPPGAEAWLLELFGDPVAEPWGDAGPGPVSFYAGAPGLAFHQSAGGVAWIYFALVDDRAVRAKVSGQAPIRHWALTPEEGA